MKKIQRMVSLLLVCCLFVSLLPASVQAAVVDSGACGSNVTWKLDSDGTLTIAGTGDMTDYDSLTGRVTTPWAHCLSDVTSVIIEEGVTSIGEEAFYKCANLMSVSIPDSVTSIGESAFNRCEKLGSIDIPNGVASIGMGAFYACESLESLFIPASVEKLEFGEGAFSWCAGLTSIEVDKDNPSYTSVDGILFTKDMKTLLRFPANHSKTEYVVPSCVNEIRTNAFHGCINLKNISIGNNVQSIAGAFKYSTSLEDVSIPDGISDLSETFWGCAGLTSVTIPDSVTTLWYTFGECTSLTDVYYGGTEEQWEDIYNRTNDEWLSNATIHFLSGSSDVPDGMVYLENLKIQASDRYTGNMGDSFINALGTAHGKTDIHGNVMEHGLEVWIARWNGVYETSWAWAEYALNGQYSSLSGKVTILADAYNITNFDSTLAIIGDGKTLYSCALTPGMNVISVNVDISGVDTLRIHVYDNSSAKGGTAFALWDFAVSKGNIEPGEGTYSSEIDGLTISKMDQNYYIFLGDSHIYNMDSPDSPLYTHISVRVDEKILSSDDIAWNSSDESIFKIVSVDTPFDDCIEIKVEGISEGTATLTATDRDGNKVSLEIAVVNPNELKFTNIYDTKQYYYSGAFYSAASSISDSVEIFVQFENKQIEGYPCKIEEELIENVSVIEPITLTASILGSGLSFDRNSYQSTYSATYDAIEFNTGIYDLLMLFPYDTESFVAGSSYVVEIILESASFDAPLIETYSFTVYDAETQRVDEHINFINSNAYYKVSKQNIYGENMLELKDDPEYNWSYVTTLNFDNYYEVVWADVLLGMLSVDQTETSIVLTVLKDWHETYKTLLNGVSTIAEDSYGDVANLESAIDKILKASKYDSEATCADKQIYQCVVDMFGEQGNTDSIRSAFKVVDRTGQVFSLVEFTGDVVFDFIAWANTVNVMNAFADTDENFKEVFRALAERIPDENQKMKEAVEDYLNYSYDHSSYVSELHELMLSLGKDVGFDVLDDLLGKEWWEFLTSTIMKWIGKIPLKGSTATFASTTAYASLTTAVGSVTTGVSLGLWLSDLICDSEDKATEMSKIIAMSEYTPYVIQTLESYEGNLYSAANNDSVDLFEKAFDLHKASQSYIMEHTVSALEVKADSILQTILGNDDYDKLVADILVQKNAIDNMECCGTLTDDTIVYTTKVIAIKCPVDVYVYIESGEEIVRIINDTLEYVADGLSVYIRDGAKYIALPATQVYSVKIIATDNGSMDYLVMEFDDASQLVRRLEERSIPLAVDRVFTGEVVEELGVVPESYGLTYENTEYVPTEPEHTEPEPTEPEPTEPEDMIYVSRLAGDNRFLTAIAVADQMKSEMNVEKFDAVIVASGTNFADALSGSYLAAVKNAPILLSCNEDYNPNLVDKYNTIVLDYIKENLNTNGTVYILGGPKAVAPVLDEALKGYKVKRLAGANRYATNIAILEEAGVVGKDVLICNGEGFADSLSASATELPILLVNSKYGLFDLQEPFLEGCDGKFYIIGGTSAVSGWVESQLQKYGSIERIGGKDRFETSVMIAEQFFETPDAAVLAYGWNFPDGLCGGSLAAAINAPLILTMSDHESYATDYTDDKGISDGYVLGSDKLISDASVKMIFDDYQLAIQDIAIRSRAYCVGDTLDADTLELTAIYTNGKTKRITQDYTITPQKLENSGRQKITITYGGKTGTYYIEVLDFYELSAEVQAVSGEGYNEDRRANWVLYIAGRYVGNYAKFSFEDNLETEHGRYADWALCWEDAKKGGSGGTSYSCTEDFEGEKKYGVCEFILPDDPNFAGEYFAKLTFGDITKTVTFTLVYKGDYEIGTGWEIKNITWS